MLSLPAARIQTLVRELKSRKPRGMAKKKRERERESTFTICEDRSSKIGQREKLNLNAIAPETPNDPKKSSGIGTAFRDFPL